MANCIKTGCHVFIVEYGVYLRGDAFAIGAGHETLYYFRLNNWSSSFEMHNENLHFTILKVDSWFDPATTDGMSTLIALHAVYHGYEGKSSNVTPLRS